MKKITKNQMFMRRMYLLFIEIFAQSYENYESLDKFLLKEDLDKIRKKAIIGMNLLLEKIKD